MIYADGQSVSLGDRVAIAHDVTGVVVLLIEAGVAEEDFPSAEWAYLERGILVKSRDVGLIHYPSRRPSPHAPVAPPRRIDAALAAKARR